MIRKPRWLNKLSWLFGEAALPCQTVDLAPAFPISHLCHSELSHSERKLTSDQGLQVCSSGLCSLYTDKWLGLFSAVWGWTRLQSCWDETEGVDALLHLYTSFLCITSTPSSLTSTRCNLPHSSLTIPPPSLLLHPFHRPSVFPLAFCTASLDLSLTYLCLW